jgi:ribosome-binding protein aMBF1 (putative translation factor)
MDYCYRCGVDESEIKMFDVISKEGIVKICVNCAEEIDLPVVRRQKDIELKPDEPKGSVYDRLSRMSGVGSDFMKQKRVDNEEARKELMKRQKDISLRELVERKYKQDHEKDIVRSQRDDLIDNFHWVLMRARRSEKLTQDQLAVKIGESSELIKLAENGIVSDSDYRLLNKLETFFGIVLIKKKESKEGIDLKTKPDFDMNVTDSKEIKIRDLKEMKEKRESIMRDIFRKRNDDKRKEMVKDASDEIGSFGKSGDYEIIDDKIINEEIDLNNQKSLKNLSEDEISDLIFGRKKK